MVEQHKFATAHGEDKAGGASAMLAAGVREGMLAAALLVMHGTPTCVSRAARSLTEAR